MTTVLVIGLASVALRTAIDSGSGDDEGDDATPPSTIVDGVTVALLTLVDCEASSDDAGSEDQPACNPDGVLVGNDVYVVNAGVDVLPGKVTDQVFAASPQEALDDDGAIEFAYIIENVDPAVLLAGSTGSSFVAITGPSVESTTAEPTIEVLFGVCVSLTDAASYGRCRELAEPAPEGGG